MELVREFPRTITVAQPRKGYHVLHNNSRIPIKARIYEDSYPHITKQYNTKLQRVLALSKIRWPVRITVDKRGEQPLGGAGLRVTAGLGLWVLQYRFEWDDEVRVYPLIEELARGDLFAHRRKLWGLGQHRSRKYGRGTEFEQLREYTPDDEYRSMNWKATANI